MACDHFSYNQFKRNMGIIFDSNESIKNEYERTLSHIEELYKGWKSVKGYQKISALSTSIRSALQGAELSIALDYNTMKEGAEEYVKTQGGANPNLLSIYKYNFEDRRKEYPADGDIDINEAIIQNAQNKVNESLTKINGYVKNMINATGSNDHFGYWTTDGTDIPKRLQKSLTSLLDNLIQNTDNYTKDFAKVLEEDKIEREARKAASVKSSSNIGSGLGY